ncbi:hypothetical protein LG047_17770 [Methylocystis sp. WRRC1]|uniref:hypothetical protein n=1 Tax=unclassified Methylocystis TaxID=2625913 RepID=UPI0001F8863F|nr:MULTISPECIES: hypothetical protein [unclassified Methylocystis]MCC3247139.1 hypothetical protein [Methylocystis sp. WRRC1]
MVRIDTTALPCGILLVALLVSPTEATAGACPVDHWGNPMVPNCQEQQMGPVHYGGWDTKGWAYYCTGDHPYFWGLANPGTLFNYNKNNNCFSVSENLFAETTPNKFDATFTNWCFKGEDITITLGCSSVPQPGAGSCSKIVGGAVKDPGCAQSNVRNYCLPGPQPVCVQEFNETCSNGTKYTCTIDQLVTWCFQCQ